MVNTSLYMLSDSGLEIGIINKEELEILKKLDTNGLHVVEVSAVNINKVLENIKNKVPLYKMEYHYETKEYITKKVDLVDIKVNDVGQVFEDNDYTKIIYSNFAKTDEEKNELMNTLKKCVDFALSTNDGGKIERFFEKHSINYVGKTIELPDNHVERTKVSKIKSDMIMESLKKMMLR